jgi:hypothetical protein
MTFLIDASAMERSAVPLGGETKLRRRSEGIPAVSTGAAQRRFLKETVWLQSFAHAGGRADGVP